jgi:hypothetical protein
MGPDNTGNSPEQEANAALTKIKQGALAMMKTLLKFATLVFSTGPLFANPYYTDRLDDRQAIYLTGDKFSIHGDGIADDSDVLQQAINRVQQTTNQGILFLPYRRYRVTEPFTSGRESASSVTARRVLSWSLVVAYRHYRGPRAAFSGSVRRTRNSVHRRTQLTLRRRIAQQRPLDPRLVSSRAVCD